MEDLARGARVLDVLRDGGNNATADRETAAAVEELFPGARRMIEWCDRFAVAAAALAVTLGMASVIFGGTGFPVGTPPHRAVLAGRRRPGPGPWWGYADGPGAVTSARAMSLDEDEAAAFTGCTTDPKQAMEAARLAGMPPGPLQVQLGLTAAAIPGDLMPVLVGRWAAELTPGSQIAMLVPLGGFLAAPGIYGAVPAHAPQDAAAWFKQAGMDLVRPLADVRAWERQEWDEAAIRLDRDTRIVAAVGHLLLKGHAGAAGAACGAPQPPMQVSAPPGCLFRGRQRSPAGIRQHAPHVVRPRFSQR